MCGIIYRKSLNNENISTDILNMYKNQRSRGFQGFGYYLPRQNKIVHTTDEHIIIKKLKATKSFEMLFHHRFPTSTDNVQNACHPFKVRVSGKDYIVVHNGYLYNDRELKAHHESLGYKYQSIQPNGKFNDSEALAYDLALYLSGKQRKLKSEGAIAFIVYTGDDIYFGRNSDSPLHYHVNDKYITIRSEGKGELIKTDTLYRLRNGKLSQAKLTIPSYNYRPSTNYNAFGYYDDDAIETTIWQKDQLDTWVDDDTYWQIEDTKLAIDQCERELINTPETDTQRIAELEWYLDELILELSVLKGANNAKLYRE